MGKFDKFNKPNFKLKGLLALALFLGIIVIFIIFVIKKCFGKNEKTSVKNNKKREDSINNTLDYSDDATSNIEYKNNSKIIGKFENKKLSKQSLKAYKELAKNKIYK